MTTSVRRLLRRPVFAVATIGLLGATSGMAITVGSVVRDTLVRSLPYPDEDRLVALYWSRLELGIPDMAWSLPPARELLERSSAFEAVAVTRTPLSATAMIDGRPTHLVAGLASPEAFSVLGVEACLGRSFDAAEGEPGTGSDAVVLGHGAWLDLFGGASEALGASLVINGTSRTVVGVLPPARSLAPEQPVGVDVWFPMGVAEEVLGQPVFGLPGAASFRVNARITRQTTAEALRVELARVNEAIALDYPDSYQGWRLNSDPLRERIFGRAKGPLTALVLGSLIFTAVALLNLTGLLYQRADQESGHVAIRRALGATRARVAELRLTDAVTIGVGAATVGVALGAGASRILDRLDPLGLPEHVAVTFGWADVWAITASSFAAAIAVGLVAGALADARSPAGLASRGRTGPMSPPSRSGLLALGAQVALSTSLTVASVALVRSLADLRRMDVGVEAGEMLSARVDVPSSLLNREEVARRGRDMVERLHELPDVTWAHLWAPELPTDAHTFTALQVEGLPQASDADPILSRYHTVSPGAVSALGLEVVVGRDMTEDDLTSGRRVVLVSSSAASRWWGAEVAALGQRIKRGSHSEWSEVIGVVADAPLSGRFGPGSDNTLDVFFMLDQDPQSTLLLFAATAPGVDVSRLRSVAGAAMAEVAVHDVRWMVDRLREQERQHRTSAGLGGIFAVASLLLAAVGLAGSSMLMARRRRVEVAIRQAMGATKVAAVLAILRGGLAGIAAGMAIGIAGARAGLGFIDPTILTVGPTDLPSYMVATLVLGACAGAALVVPSLTMLRRDLVEDLRAASA